MLIRQLESARRCFVRSVGVFFFPVDAVSAAHVYLDREMPRITREV